MSNKIQNPKFEESFRLPAGQAGILGFGFDLKFGF
jgi:hypothetical protein